MSSSITWEGTKPNDTCTHSCAYRAKHNAWPPPSPNALQSTPRMLTHLDANSLLYLRTSEGLYNVAYSYVCFVLIVAHYVRQLSAG